MIDTKQVLQEMVERDVMACIGCHDCMLACPLPEARLITIAELNAAVHLPTIRAENVAAFVGACTQCRQCVPACPADLSRADIVLFNKMKLEDAVPDHVLMLQCGTHVEPSQFTLDSLATQLGQVALFAGASREDLRRLILKVTLRRLAAGEQLCTAGEFHERLYVVLQGALEQWSAGPRNMRVRILVVPPGSFFGELAVMADQPEPFSVTALEPAVVLEIPKVAVHRMMTHSAAFRATMESLYRRRALWSYLQKAAIFKGFPEAALEELMGAAELDSHDAGEVVFKAGDRPKDIYLVRSGFYRAGIQMGDSDVALVYFREGDTFGAFSILYGEATQSFTVAASCRSELIRIPSFALDRLFARFPQGRTSLDPGAFGAEQAARMHLMTVWQAPQLAAASATRKPVGTMAQPLVMEALVQAGVAKGTEVLVIDQNRCTNCQSCIDACGTRHGHSRLQLRGIQLETLLIPTACRHCEDPVCLLCSVNGIVRKPTGEITIQPENCVGCGACADRCPYGNISMHPVEKPKRGFLRGIWELMWGKNERRAELVNDPKVPRIAVKCDLCAGYQDYACVSACPVGAAARIDPRKALGDGLERVDRRHATVI